jgi:TPP-dependent pyruvate/acetoin dehydrogenase alpha subunit
MSAAVADVTHFPGRLLQSLLETGVLSRADVDQIREEVKSAADAATEWADAQPERTGASCWLMSMRNSRRRRKPRLTISRKNR